MKYEEEYKLAEDRQEFIEILLRSYPQLKKATALRRYYDLRKRFEKVTKSVRKNFVTPYVGCLSVRPIYLKLLMLQDMLEKDFTLTNSFLRNHGFKSEEINWLIENGKL